MAYQVGEWVWSREQRLAGQVLDQQALWEQTVYRVWFPDQETVQRISAEKLQPLAAASTLTADDIVYRATAARVADALAQDVLLAPIEAPVIPLPHQIRALGQVVAGDQLRFLLADEVGLGKTIEAGLVMRELKLRGLAQRILVVAPKGLVTQWVAEMRTHFNEDFRLIIPSTAVQLLEPDQNLWRQFDQVVCPMDSVKPMEKRRGWSTEQVEEYNRQRFDDLITAGWDLIVVDEAHRLGGSTDQVARYQLGQGLAEAAPYLLLLSATPHQGKTDAFRRLMSLLDADAFPDDGQHPTASGSGPMSYAPKSARRSTPQGKPLFKPRLTKLSTVAWDSATPRAASALRGGQRLCARRVQPGH